jgi:hypothetical protein
MCCISRSPGSLKKAPNTKRQVQIFPDKIEKRERSNAGPPLHMQDGLCDNLPNKLEVINKPARLEIGWKRRHLPYKTAFQRQGKGTARDWPSGQGLLVTRTARPPRTGYHIYLGT